MKYVNKFAFMAFAVVTTMKGMEPAPVEVEPIAEAPRVEEVSIEQLFADVSARLEALAQVSGKGLTAEQAATQARAQIDTLARIERALGGKVSLLDMRVVNDALASQTASLRRIEEALSSKLASKDDLTVLTERLFPLDSETSELVRNVRSVAKHIPHVEKLCVIGGAIEGAATCLKDKGLRHLALGAAVVGAGTLGVYKLTPIKALVVGGIYNPAKKVVNGALNTPKHVWNASRKRKAVYAGAAVGAYVVLANRNTIVKAIAG